MHSCTLKLDDKLFKPGTLVSIGPTSHKFQAMVYRVDITLYADGTSGILYAVEWWEDTTLCRETLRADQVSESHD